MRAKRSIFALGGGFGLAFIISYTMTGEIMAKDVSSPQTTELNAADRAPTLMKYVHIGQFESLGVVAFAAYFDKQFRTPILLGGISGVVVNEVLYQHALARGIRNGGKPTETHAHTRMQQEGYYQYG